MNSYAEQNPLQAEWRNSNSVCALADRERHLGHIIRMGSRWHAFDATHFNQEGNGFRSLGAFSTLQAAKSAIETACLVQPQISYAGAA